MRVEHGDCLDVMRRLADEGVQVDAVVTDPPAGIGFMNAHWDKDKGGRDQWVRWMADCAEAALALVKPGGHAFVWALPRTSHWTGWAWEDAGWQPRDKYLFLFGTGFPKSLDVSKAIDRAAGAERAITRNGQRKAPEFAGKFDMADSSLRERRDAPATDAARQWEGWGTAAKPAHEDWWLFRKPLALPTVAAQVMATGTGALNIDGCRVEAAGRPLRVGDYKKTADNVYEGRQDGSLMGGSKAAGSTDLGRWPANVLHDSSPEVLEAFARFGSGKGAHGQEIHPAPRTGGDRLAMAGRFNGSAAPRHAHNDTGTAARFFPALGFTDEELRFHYSAKASRADRAGSKHPTVKPVALMRWLCRLVTPPGGVILDPFAGSGTTGQAAREEGFDAILIEREAEYVADINRRLASTVPPLFAGAA